jgi:hypothetical protein
LFNLKFKIFFTFFLLLAFIIAATQPFGYSPDYTQYEFFFQQIRFDFLRIVQASRFEPGFSFLSGTLSWAFSSDIMVYSFLVAIAMFLKLIYTRKISFGIYFYLAIIFYFSKFFILHELTQLRVALAISFIFASCFWLWNGMRWKGVIGCVCATSFHYSSLMLFPFLFAPKLNRTKSLAIALFIFIVLSLISHYVVDLAGKFFPVFESYESSALLFHTNDINPLSPVLLPEFFLLIMSFIFWHDLTENMQKIVFIELIGFAIFYSLIDYQVVAVRGREFFSVLWTLFIAQAGFCKSRLQLSIFISIFILATIMLSIYQYFYLDFFTNKY